MRYYIADCHFYHESLNTRMDHRGFANAAEMNAHMIACWNRKVKKGDEVVVIGDLSMGKGEETNAILEQLNGRIFLIKGNHDNYLHDKAFDQTKLEWVENYKELNDNHRKVVLCHYPTFCYNGQYRLGKDQDSQVYMLYGHVHDTYDEKLVDSFIKQTRNTKREVHGQEEPVAIPCKMINCFCMFSNYEPLSLDEWIEVDAKRRAAMDETKV